MSSILFFCAVCGEALSAELSFAGEIMDCSRCGRSVPVPGFLMMRGGQGCAAVYPPEVLSVDVIFLCRRCGSKLVVDGRMEGREFDCPECDAPVKAPIWSRPAREPTNGRTPGKERPILTPEEIGFLSGESNHSFAL
jgi:DNA-directed RNA polymerase subunit RPC12/RpoP